MGGDGRGAKARSGEKKGNEFEEGGEWRSSRGVEETFVTKTACDRTARAISKESEGGKEERGEGKRNNPTAVGVSTLPVPTV